MDIIAKQATHFVRQYLSDSTDEHKVIIDSAKNQLSEIDSSLDKIRFLKIILEGNDAAYTKHQPACKNPDNCQINYAHESIAYYLAQELNRLGVIISEDTFTRQDEVDTDSKLDQILSDLEEIKMGHQIIYDDLYREISELKEFYFLGKKKWHQLFVGKCFEMVASGVISETVSKQIVSTLDRQLTGLLSG